MGENLNPNSARAGLDLDSTTGQIRQGSVSYALNATIIGFDGNQVTYQNEQGNEVCTNLPEGYKVICAHPIIEKYIIVFFLVHPAGHSEIGVLDTKSCSYTTKINQDCLNFSINDPVRKAVHKITSCSTEIYWRDNNGRRYMDLDNLPYAENIADCETNASTTTIDCNRLLIQPNFNVPFIDYQGTDSEGEITSGAYQFAFQYANSLGEPYTAFYSFTPPIPVTDRSKVTGDFNFKVGKSIKLDITGIDTTGIFDFYNILAIKTINNITSFDLIGTYEIERTHQTIVYTGQNLAAANLTADDVFEKFTVYDKADDLTSVQDILIWKGLSAQERISWQKIANQIKLQWQTYVLPYTSDQYKDPVTSANQKGYFRDEVYALEFCPIYTNGSIGDGFHIPGRAIMDTDTTLVENYDLAKSTTECDPNEESLPKWKVYNTAFKQGNVVHLCTEKNAPAGCADNCYNGPHEYGEFAYWESVETYPCDEAVWGDLSGKNIRHHKFPDSTITPHFDSFGNVFPIGIKIDLDAINELIKASTDLTQEQKDKIAGFKILRSNRANNKSVVAKGIFYNVGKYIKNDTTYFYPNYPYNDIRPDPFISGSSNSPIFTNVLSQEKQISNTGMAESALDEQPVSGNNLYHGTTFTFSGVFNNAQGPRTIKLYLEPEGGSEPKYTIFDSGELNVGQGSSWSLNVTTAFTKVVRHGLFGGGLDGWDMKFIGNLDAFGTYNKNVYDDVDQEIPGGFDNKWRVILKATGTATGDVTLTSTDIDQASVEVVQTEQLDGFSDDDSKERFTFHSPDTSFYQPVLGGNKVVLDGILFGSAVGHYTEVLHHAKYKFPSLNSYLVALGVGVVVGFASGQYGVADRPYDGVATFTTVQFLDDLIYKLIPRKNFAFQYNSVGHYDNFKIIPNGTGNKIRSCDLASYILPGYNSAGDVNLINNYQRESSVYLKLNQTLPIPNEFTGIPEDISRVTLTALNHCDTPTTNFSRDISAFYGGIKKPNLNQYGQIYSYDTIDTAAQFLITDTGTRTVFGGDCFINKFAFKRKMPFFLDNRVTQPDDSDVFYDELGNVGFPTYWFSTDIQKGTGGNFNVGSLFGVKVNHFDCNPHKFFYDSGKMYLFAYGIPNFFCESEVNVDYRQATNALEGDYYPHVGNGIPDDWFTRI